MKIIKKGQRGARRRGSAMAAVMSMFILVTLAGVAIMATVSTAQRQLLHYSLTSRLRAATENALESTRGQFTLVAGVQENWNALLPSGGWNVIQNHTIDSVTVQVSAMSIGTAAVPRVRLRGIGTLAGRQWAVEYEFKQTTFGDFAMYTGGPNVQGIPANTKVNGNYYAQNSINLSNRAYIEFFKGVSTSGSIQNAPDPVYNFKEGYSEGVDVIAFENAGTSFANADTQATGTGTKYYSNTISIQFSGTNFIRTYNKRNSPGTPASYTDGATETVPIPNNGIIYISNSAPPAGVDAPAGYSVSGSHVSPRPTSTGLNIWGVIDNRKVTVYCEDEVTITNNLTYQDLLDHPDWRRFGEKESPAAKSVDSLLGIVSSTDLDVDFTTFTALPSSANVTDNAAYTAWDGRVWNDTGHEASQFAVDGVFVSYSEIERAPGGTSSTNKEFWFCGSVISGAKPVNNLLDLCERTNLDWDWRLEDQDPPFLIRIYGRAPSAIAKTFKSYAP